MSCDMHNSMCRLFLLVLRPRSTIGQTSRTFQNCLIIDLSREASGSKKFSCLGVRFWHEKLYESFILSTVSGAVVTTLSLRIND